MSEDPPPGYRLRLFLSVDLVGSTEYKNEAKKTKRWWIQEWVQTFREFYKTFPEKLEKCYEGDGILKNDDRVLSELERKKHPRVWKTIGDEIVFCCTIISLNHLCACLDAFITTLQKYPKENFESKNIKLDTKGNAWVASFPYPNVTIKIGDIAMGRYGSEETEKHADEDPLGYDFLGKDIDAGFRIAKNSSKNELTISPLLALLLYKSKCYQKQHSTHMTCCNRPVRFKGTQIFKGVVKNAPYPVLIINTCRKYNEKKLKDLELELLSHPKEADNEKLIAYIEKYIKVNGIEQQRIKQEHDDDDIDPPSFYLDIKKEEEEEESISVKDNDAREFLDKEKADITEQVKKIVPQKWKSDK